MKDHDYAFAVARIRANEARLLGAADFDALIDAPGIPGCVELLRSKGLIDQSGSFGGVSDFVDEQISRLWTLLNESVPDRKALSAFCVKNDFFNLKAALKCALSGLSADGFFKAPTSLDPDELKKAAERGDFSALDEPYASACEEAFATAMKTENGQSLDVILDRAALEMMKNCAGRADDGLTAKILNFLIGCADVKIAFRAARAKKARSFIDKCLCPCDGLDVERLAECAESGEAELFDHLSKTPFSEGSGILKTDGAAFEKWADDSLIDMIGEAKYKFFGFEPIAAYYYARMNEIEMLRLILSAKSSGLPEGVIRERMRKLYV